MHVHVYAAAETALAIHDDGRAALFVGDDVAADDACWRQREDARPASAVNVTHGQPSEHEPADRRGQ